MKKGIQVTLIISLGILLCSTCTYKSSDPNICFQENIQPIFISNCAGCHGGMSNYDGIVPYVKKNHPQQSEIYKRIRGANPSMPPPSHNKLSEQQVYYIKTWISMGAKNSSNCSLCDTSAHKFAADIQPIMKDWCGSATCHNSSTLGGGFDLSNYNGVKSASISGKLMGCINHSSGFFPMPQGGGTLPACQTLKIQNWIKAGNPNN